MLTAKMIGMTPAIVTFSGRYCVWPWYMRRPRTRLAYWTGMRRWPSLMKTTAAMTTTATIDERDDARERVGTREDRADLPRDAADDAGEDDEADAVAEAALADQLAEPHEQDRAGGEAEQQADRLDAEQVVGRDDAVRAQQHADAVALGDRERHGQHAGVLVEPVAAVLALAAQLLERWDHAAHELHDDAGVDVRVHPEADDRRGRQAASREDVQDPEQRVVREQVRSGPRCSRSGSARSSAPGRSRGSRA